MRVLVLGASGTIGRALLPALDHQHDDDRGAGRPASRHGHAPWVSTPTQPITLADVVHYLAGLCGQQQAFGIRPPA